MQRTANEYTEERRVYKDLIRPDLANSLSSLRDINLTLGLLPPRRHVVLRDSVGFRSSGSGLKSGCADNFSSEPDLWSLRHTVEP